MSKRTSLPADAVEGLFPKPEPAPEPEPTKPKKRDEEEYSRRYGRPTTYRLPDELTDHIRAIAEAEGVGLSELAEYALTRFVKDYDAGKVTLPKKRTAYRLDFDPLD